MRSVIDQALHDLGARDVRVREDAMVWFDPLNENFLEICEMAEVQPQKVLDFIALNYDDLTNPRPIKSTKRSGKN